MAAPTNDVRTDFETEYFGHDNRRTDQVDRRLTTELKKPMADSTIPTRCLRVARKTGATLALLVCPLLVLAASTGCVQRRLIVRTQPEGAFLTIDQQPIGYTPVAVPFTYYGTREIKLEKDGFKTVEVRQRIRPPWYERIPVSFFAEHFSPRELRDERVLDFQLEPRQQVDPNFLLDRAANLRTDVQRGTVTVPIDK